MGGCQNYGRFLGILHIRCRIITGIPKRAIILTSTHVDSRAEGFGPLAKDYSRLVRDCKTG